MSESAATSPPVDRLVVVGASAGGIEALSALLSRAPSEFPAPIVIAQHLDPSRASHLQEILARHSALPVHTVLEREALAPGVVYVVPSNRHVEITDHEVEVLEDDGRGPRPSIDRLLQSAAQVFGENLIAVILTGTGSDGAAGARAVKEFGGTVVIQNPATARYPSMPMSLAPTSVDIIANLENLGALLHDLVTGVYAPTQPEETRTLRGLLDQLRIRSNIDFSAYKMPTIMRRIERRMAATNTQTLAAYVRHLQRHPDEHQRLINSFLIKVTDFFRDPDLFDHLRDRVLSELIEDARARGNELRIWSAGCATGEEAYSLAILVADALGEELNEFTVRIFATDLDADAIAFARRGIYPASVLTSLPDSLIERHFTKLNGAYEISKRVRALTVFGQHDLGQRAPFPRIDLTLCRNVLIYFTTELQKRALQLFAFSLRESGFLVLGKAETVSPLAEYFVLEQPRLKIYRRHGERVLIPPARIADAAPAPVRMTPNRPALGGMELELARAQRPLLRVQSAIEKGERLLLNLPAGIVVVNRHYDIQTINNAARVHFGIHTAAINEDFLHLIRRVSSQALRAAIDAAFAGEATIRVLEATPQETMQDEPTFLQVTCQPVRAGEVNDSIDMVVILATDIGEHVQQQRALQQAVTSQQSEIEMLQARIDRLGEDNRVLRAANQELTTVNADLRSTNEELLVGNEEAQAATEEVETLNEELQATNEELETLNEELQATIEELNTTNDDLQARSVELHEMAASVEEQRRLSEDARARLEAILASMGDAVLVVDPSGTPLVRNASYEQWFGDDLPPAEDVDGRPLPPDATPQARAARGETFSMEFIVTAPDGARRWFEANGRPGQADSHGGVIVIRDITERSLHRLQNEFVAMASHELRTPLAALQGYLGMVLRTLPASARQARARDYAARALEQAQQMATLVNDLLDVTRLQTGRLHITPEPVALGPLVRRAVEVAQTLAQGQTIALDVGHDALTVSGDPHRLEQVLLNLLTNAITYAPNTERIDVRLRRAGDTAEIEVQDYGPGIPAADLPHVFSRYFHLERTGNSQSQGLGLGLYISHEIVVAHDGEIAVTSSDGTGTRFTVRLPLHAESR